MLKLDFVSVLLVLSVFSFLVVTAYVLWARTHIRTSATWLAAFLAFTTLSLGHFLYLTQSNSPAPLFAYLPNTIGLAAAPCLYLFARSAVGRKNSLRSIIHLAPVPFFVLIVLLTYTLKPEVERIAIVSNPDHPSLLNSTWLLASIFFFVSVYLLATLRLVRIQGRRFKEWFSRPGVGDLRWLQISLVGMLVVWALSVLHGLVAAQWPNAALDRFFVYFFGRLCVRFCAEFSRARPAPHAPAAATFRQFARTSMDRTASAIRKSSASPCRSPI